MKPEEGGKMRLRWVAFIVVFGILALAPGEATQAQKIQRPESRKAVEKVPFPTASFTITEPKSTSTPWVHASKTWPILWTKNGVPQPATVKIELRDAAGTATIHTFAENAGNSGTCNVTLPNSVGPGTYKIHVSGTGASGTSEAFQISGNPWHVTLPPNPWTVGSAKTITWTSTQPPSVTLTFYLRVSPYEDFILLKSGVLNDGSETVTVPNRTGSFQFVIMPNSGAYGSLEFGGGTVQIVSGAPSSAPDIPSQGRIISEKGKR
jgi:hypothetical protein